jgi:hypothetical protein
MSAQVQAAVFNGDVRAPIVAAPSGHALLLPGVDGAHTPVLELVQGSGNGRLDRGVNATGEASDDLSRAILPHAVADKTNGQSPVNELVEQLKTAGRGSTELSRQRRPEREPD